MGIGAAFIPGRGAGAVVQRPSSGALPGRSARAGSFAHSEPWRSQVCAAAGAAAEMSPQRSFHQNRMSAAMNASAADLPPLHVLIRVAERDDELQAVAWLRARSFYAYPPERRFAGEIHQAMVADEEFKGLKAQRLQRKLDEGGAAAPAERSACLVALHAAGRLGGETAAADEALRVSDDGEAWLAVVGTLDLHAVRALPGEVLIGSCSNAAYLANVCTSSEARRRGAGSALLGEARALARRWGVEGLYVHTMAVNEVALGFYERNGFVVEREESSNRAHYRGRCLDGVEGRGRTVLLRDTRLHV